MPTVLPCRNLITCHFQQCILDRLFMQHPWIGNRFGHFLLSAPRGHRSLPGMGTALITYAILHNVDCDKPETAPRRFNDSDRPVLLSSVPFSTMAHAGIKSQYWPTSQSLRMLKHSTVAVILLSFVLAVGFLLIILSCALWSNWLPLLVGTFPIHLRCCGLVCSCDRSPDICPCAASQRALLALRRR